MGKGGGMGDKFQGTLLERQVREGVEIARAKADLIFGDNYEEFGS